MQANWPAVLYPAASIAAAAYAARWWKQAAALGFAVSALVYIQAAAAILPLPRKLDFTLIRLGGWDGWVAQVAAQEATQGAAFVAADNYGLASILARGLPGPVVGSEPRWALFDLPSAATAGQTGLLVRSQRRAGAPDPGPWQSNRAGRDPDTQPRRRRRRGLQPVSRGRARRHGAAAQHEVNEMDLPTHEDVLTAYVRIAGQVVRTPMLRHPLLDERTGGTILIKPEPLQRTGSFKLRGATNAALRLLPAQRAAEW